MLRVCHASHVRNWSLNVRIFSVRDENRCEAHVQFAKAAGFSGAPASKDLIITALKFFQCRQHMFVTLLCGKTPMSNKVQAEEPSENAGVNTGDFSM